MKIKRVIGVITVLENIAVQSFGYKKYLPLGSPSILAENLDRWGADEILMIDINASKNNRGPNLELLYSLRDINLSTPLIYGGGIRNNKDAKSVIKNGADRILIETLADTKPSEVSKIAQETGKQAIIRCICVRQKGEMICRYDYINKKTKGLENGLDKLIDEESCSELMIADVDNEGEKGKFNSKILQTLKKKVNIIVYGGIGTGLKAKELLLDDTICAIAVGNQLNYTEETIYKLKNQISDNKVRKFKLKVD